jgi:hypothetical protein
MLKRVQRRTTAIDLATLDELMQEYWKITQEIDKKGGDLKLDTYAAPHVWNLVAKTLRQSYLAWIGKPTMRKAVEELALEFAKRFTQDAGFDPVKWLDQCSPDPKRYPLSKLWQKSHD